MLSLSMGKQIYPLLWREVLSLSSKAVLYIDTWEKIVLYIDTWEKIVGEKAETLQHVQKPRDACTVVFQQEQTHMFCPKVAVFPSSLATSGELTSSFGT